MTKAIETNWLDTLMAEIPTLELGEATKSASAASKDPRDAVLALIDNSMALLADPTHKVSKRGNTYTPESCVRTKGAKYEVVLAYCREKLTLHNGKKALFVDPPHASTLLTGLKAAVEAGHFDDQLARIKTERVAKLGVSAKPAKHKKAA